MTSRWRSSQARRALRLLLAETVDDFFMNLEPFLVEVAPTVILCLTMTRLW